ncbi:GNAT family N-acetyltransferase [Seonamhaeicola sp.]|uniref:GNAT family N-acetyltransferase n=1 Tax=Seonamhaeicola sp. TaxID=1912245 RepID=UPI00261E7033|nr:GNAT family N-acetyltransferase [Seonamhaeicola sp.]
MVDKLDFYNTLTERHKVLSLYSKLELNTSARCLSFERNEEVEFSKNKAVSVKLFPSYLSPAFKNEPELNILKIPQSKINGYAVVINEKTDIQSFLKDQYSKSFKQNINRFVNRLESCFNIQYKMYYGSITSDDYQKYMLMLHDMLVTRFKQRNEKNDILENWPFYLDSTYDLINSKKASLFVIYSDNTPIHICVNHHFDKLFFVSIPSFDLDYTKFALGNISIYKLLEWALDNDYNLLDMAYGDLEYKRRWSTLIYKFDHHIVYPKNIFKVGVLAKIEYNIIAFKNVLKKYRVDKKVKQLKSLVRGKKAQLRLSTYSTIDNIDLSQLKQLTPVDMNSEEGCMLKRPLFDFLFKQKEHISNINLFKNESDNEYVIIGKNANQKISIQNT